MAQFIILIILSVMAQGVFLPTPTPTYENQPLRILRVEIYVHGEVYLLLRSL